jgi:hypothetical protein
VSAAVAVGRQRLCGPRSSTGRARACEHEPAPSGGSRLTLGQQLDSVWEGLHAGGAAECPVCHGRMTAGAAANEAACGDCGSRLA